MHTGRGEQRACLGVGQRRLQALRVVKIGQQQRGAAQFEGRVGVRADRAGQVVLGCESLRLGIVFLEQAAGVEGLDRIHQRQDAQQVGLLPVSAALDVEWVRDADEGRLGAQSSDSFLCWQAARHFLRDVSCQELAFQGHDLLADDDSLRVQRLGVQCAQDGVVVGDYHPLDALALAGCQQLFGRAQRVLGVAGVAVEVDL